MQAPRICNRDRLTSPGVAADLLASGEQVVDITSKKIAKLCEDELLTVAAAGTLQANGLLNGILVGAALALRLDTQELESLNSMIKIAVARAQNPNMKLDLLSSRVCFRKTVSMLTGGSSKFKVVEPIAASLCDSCFLHSHNYSEVVNDTDRWGISASVTLPAGYLQPSLHSPQALFWARKANKELVTKIRAHRFDKTIVSILEPELRWHANKQECTVLGWRLHVPGELSRSISMLIPLSLQVNIPSADDPDKHVPQLPDVVTGLCEKLRADLVGFGNGALFSLDMEAKAEASINVIAGLYEYVIKTKADAYYGLDTLRIVELERTTSISLSDASPAQQLCFIARQPVQSLCPLPKPKPHRKKRKLEQPVDEQEQEQAHPTVDCGGDAMDQDLEDGDVHSFKLEDADGDHDCGAALADRAIREALGVESENESVQSAMEDESELLDEAVEMNCRIGTAASNAYQEANLDNIQLDGADSYLDGVQNLSSASSVLTAAELEDEAWLRHVMLENGMQHATVTISDQKPAQPTSEPSHQHIFQAADEWKTAIRTTVEALIAMHDGRGGILGKELSLVFQAEHDVSVRVEFMHWSNPARLNGRTVDLDENRGVICPVYYMQSPSSWAGSQILLPQIGVAVRKVRKPERPQVAEHIVRLRDIFKIGCEKYFDVTTQPLLFTGGTAGDARTLCCVCSAATQFQCVCCTQNLHEGCGQLVLDRVMKSAQMPVQGLATNHLLKLFVADPAEPDQNPAAQTLGLWAMGQPMGADQMGCNANEQVNRLT